ncbi:MAG: hypothetical protein ABI197_04510 [Granulicella sp.]
MSDPLFPNAAKGSDDGVLKVTLDDLDAITLPSATVIATSTSTSGATVYGSINDTPDDPAMPEDKASVWLQGWLYLGSAGLLGALLGWAICEPAFLDNGTGAHRWEMCGCCR